MEPTTARRGEVVEWTLTVRNEGEGALEGGILTDLLDESLELIEVTGAASQGNQVTGSLNIEPGESAEVVVRMRVALSAGVSISNQAEIPPWVSRSSAVTTRTQKKRVTPQSCNRLRSIRCLRSR